MNLSGSGDTRVETNSELETIENRTLAAQVIDLK